MKPIKGLAIFAFIITVTGCASMYTPGSNTIDSVPVVKIGDKKPDNNEYILYIPANSEFPVHFTIKGNLITQPVDQKPKTKIKNDLYIYKYWSSLDGRKWQPSHDLIQMPIGVGVDPEGGQVHVNLDLVTE